MSCDDVRVKERECRTRGQYEARWFGRLPMVLCLRTSKNRQEADQIGDFMRILDVKLCLAAPLATKSR